MNNHHNDQQVLKEKKNFNLYLTCPVDRWIRVDLFLFAYKKTTAFSK